MKKRSVGTKIPVFVITGHLGAGKTSLINHLLTQSSGLKIGVIVNDFGDINIDAGLVDRYSEELVALSNGCLCCSLSNELDDSLNKLATSASALDLILIEASGVADSYQMAELLFNSQNPFIVFQDLIYLIDGVNFKDFYQQQSTLAQTSLQSSRLIIVNKTDLIGPEALAEIETIIRQHQPKAIIQPATNGQIDLNLLVDQPESAVQLKLGHHHSQADQDYTKFSFSDERVFDPLKLTDLLNNLPTNVYRLKGWFYFGKKARNRRLLIQVVGRHHTIQAETKPTTRPMTEIVAIGQNFDQQALFKKIIACIDQHPNQITPENSIDPKNFDQL